MRKLRGLVANRLVEITTRTFQGRYLLRPSPEVNQTILGVLGRGQKRTGIGICGFSFLSNHYHMLVVPESTQQLSEFMGFVNGNIARKVGRLHGWRGRLWDRRYQHIIVSDEPEAQIGRLRYLLSQGVKEGLVRHPEDWPGVHCAAHLRAGIDEIAGGVWQDQTAVYNARRIGKALEPEDFLFNELVRLRPIPRLKGRSRLDQLELIKQLFKEIEQMARERRGKTGKAPLGKKRVLRQDPEFRPAKVERSPAPAFHAVSREHHQELREQYWGFFDAYRESAKELKRGMKLVVFPEGCFPPGLPYVPEARAGP